MIELNVAVLDRAAPEPFVPALAVGRIPEYRGPDRRRGDRGLTRRLAAALDEIDYGIVLLDEQSRMLHANLAARADLDEDHPLSLSGGRLHARAERDAAVLNQALSDACRRDRRKLLSVGRLQEQVSVAVVPLGGASAEAGAATLVVFGKRNVCETLSVQAFARGHGLTAAETRVLVALCEGQAPHEAAVGLGVAISTVRTQICSIRMKTGAQSIGELLRQVAVLPPMMGALRASCN